jgi:hypothetical protein
MTDKPRRQKAITDKEDVKKSSISFIQLAFTDHPPSQQNTQGTFAKMDSLPHHKMDPNEFKRLNSKHVF